MSHDPLAFGLTDRYNDFLFAQISEQANGMPLSVLSALARANVDPWEEAVRLETMPRGAAERALVETLSKLPGRTWSLSEAGQIAARLVQLLQHATHPAPKVRDAATTGGTQLINYWLLWLVFIIAMSLSQPRHSITVSRQNHAAIKLDSGIALNNDVAKTLSHTYETKAPSHASAGRSQSSQ